MPWHLQQHRCHTCGKWAYHSRRDARRAYKALHPGESRLNAYRCPDRPEFWHYGHKPGCQGRPVDATEEQRASPV